jgi:hypothetical protein
MGTNPRSDSTLIDFLTSVSESSSVSSKSPLDAATEGVTFLFNTFAYDTFTFHYQSGNHVVVRPYKSTDINTAISDALEYNRKGYDIYHMVNEGDGVTTGTGKTVRNFAAITTLSKLFIDTDTCPITTVESYLSSVDLTPHIKIESSPGRFHLYFFIDPIEKTDPRWKTLQDVLSHLGDPDISKDLGTDFSMNDPAKLLRVPGFFHIKHKTLVTLISDNTHLPAYDISQLYLSLNASSFTRNRPLQHTYTIPESVTSGNRNTAYVSYAMHLANLPISDTDKLNAYRSMVLLDTQHTDNEYVDSNALTPKSLSIFTTALAKVAAENTPPPPQNIDEPAPSPWVLPDEFYTSAPNGFGHIVKSVMDNSMFPCASLAFGTFLAGVSAVKSISYLTPNKSTPALYVINVAISGYGKSDPMNMLQNTLANYNLKSLVENEIRSDRGLLEHLKSNNGNGLFLIDEIGNILHAMLTSDEVHLQGVKRQILQLSNAAVKRGHTLGKTSDYSKKKSNDPAPVIDRPSLAICGYTVPSVFFSVFTLDSIKEGLFSRFLPIVSDIRYIEKNHNCNKEFTITSPFFDTLHPPELSDTGEPVPSLQSNSRIQMQYTPEARSHFEAIVNEFRRLAVDVALNKKSDDSDISPIYTRVAENIERVAATLSPGDLINLETLQYAETFVRSRLHAGMENLGLITRDRGSLNITQQDAILKALTRLTKEAGPGVSRRDLYVCVRKKFKSMTEFDSVLNELVKLEQVMTRKETRGIGSKAKPTIYVYLGDIL